MPGMEFITPVRLPDDPLKEFFDLTELNKEIRSMFGNEVAVIDDIDFFGVLYVSCKTFVSMKTPWRL